MHAYGARTTSVHGWACVRPLDAVDRVARREVVFDLVCALCLVSSSSSLMLCGRETGFSSHAYALQPRLPTMLLLLLLLLLLLPLMFCVVCML